MKNLSLNSLGENKSRIAYMFVSLRTHGAGSKLTITSIILLKKQLFNTCYVSITVISTGNAKKKMNATCFLRICDNMIK